MTESNNKFDRTVLGFIRVIKDWNTNFLKKYLLFLLSIGWKGALMKRLFSIMCIIVSGLVLLLGCSTKEEEMVEKNSKEVTR